MGADVSLVCRRSHALYMTAWITNDDEKVSAVEIARLENMGVLFLEADDLSYCTSLIFLVYLLVAEKKGVGILPSRQTSASNS